MKKLFILLYFLFIGLIVIAQDSSWSHVSITVMPRVLSNKINVELDYGGETKFFSDTRMKNDEGKAVKFNSVADILNYMSREGWELITAQVFFNTNSQKLWSILMRRKEKVL
ncbi:MAG: hypothetical protein ABR503_09245 [Chitinophagaceae bacterium]